MAQFCIPNFVLIALYIYTVYLDLLIVYDNLY
jgi:hypothetical protein